MKLIGESLTILDILEKTNKTLQTSTNDNKN